jgi:uncharacterized protein YceH (UPF0502 family)
MCAVSVIYDIFAKQPNEWFLANPYRITLFHSMVEDAKQFDVQTNQPDCADPDKAKLEERIAELEQQIESLKNG